MTKNPERLSLSHRIFIIFLAFLLPMDWFSPTGLLLREFGAQPVNVLVLMVGLILAPNALNRGWELQNKYFHGKLFLIGILMLIGGGGLGFLFSLDFWDYPMTGHKNPYLQFVLQGALLACLPLAILVIRHYFANENLLNYFIKCMRWAAVAHLFFFSIDYFAMVSVHDWLFSMFRSGVYTPNIRLSGLFSEPSYYGFAVSIYLPFIYMGISQRSFSSKLFWFIVVIVSFVSLFMSGSRTGMVLILMQTLVWSLLSRHYLLFKLTALGLLAGLVATKFNLITTNKLDLSTIMRVGSVLLSINAAFDGWGLSGIGFGQFHFFYVPDYAPDFLFSSHEAKDYFKGIPEHRAHTFNLFTRLLLETGILGFIGWLLFIYAISLPKSGMLTELTHRDRFLFLSVVASFFLLSCQDFYLYLPFYILVIVFSQSRFFNRRC